MKLVSLFIAFCFTMNVFASTGSLGAFEAVFDDYQYEMNVEWDQKDVKFQEAKTNKFLKDIQTLITQEGLSQKDILSVVEKKVNNKEVVEALKLKMALAGHMNTSAELSNFMRESSRDLYTQGASWNGGVAITTYIIVGAALALGIAMWISATHGCQEYAQTCDWSGCHNNYDVCENWGYVGPHL